MAECGSRFINSYRAIALAYRLVAEYDAHEREQDKLHPFNRTAPKKVWSKGGMVKDADTR
jgi:hypothetical protein